jgi:hypothetical protein
MNSAVPVHQWLKANQSKKKPSSNIQAAVGEGW